jgi:integrase
MGMNSIDLYNCDNLQDTVITYYRSKTTGRRLDKAKMQVKIPPILLPLVMKYKDYTSKRVFKFYQMYNTANNFNRAINIGLKEVGRVVKIDDLEYYAARHSWATLAVNKVGIDKYTVHAALNHIDEAMKVTDIYIERDFKIENEANLKVLKYVFGSEGLK